MAGGRDTPEKAKGSDAPALRNSEYRLMAIRLLDRLLRKATKPSFRGTVGVELSAKEGRLSQPKTTCVQFGSDD